MDFKDDAFRIGYILADLGSDRFRVRFEDGSECDSGVVRNMLYPDRITILMGHRVKVVESRFGEGSVIIYRYSGSASATRALAIERGMLTPKTDAPHRGEPTPRTPLPPDCRVLRLDDRGREASKRHVAQGPIRYMPER